MSRSNPRGSGFFGRIASGLILLTITASLVVIAYHMVGNPFGTKTIDRTAPPVLTKLEDLSSYHAASGQFEVLVDVEHDVKWMPSFLAGDRTFFVGVGSVDATVEFSGLTQENIVVSPDRTTVTVRLPEPELQEAVVDPDQSHVASRDRGLINRFAGVFTDNPTSEKPLYEEAQTKIDAAAAATDLHTRAETNTRQMLTSLLTSMGFQHVSVVFPDTAAP